ncbi:MAG: DinB family protein [Saprospiraceae bacterium]
MTQTQQIAKHLRDVYFGGNWTTVNYRTQLTDVNWQQATEQVHGFNSIATLVHHTHYYIAVQRGVLLGGPLVGKDSESFEHPPISSESDWQDMLENVWKDVEEFAQLIEQMPDDKLMEPFTDIKYGNYFRNMHGMIEHLHYHLGQIVLIKKMILDYGHNK